MKDPYQILSVSKSASADDIKRSYRKLAKKYHPDLNPNNNQIEQKFKDISQAYALLSDKEKRRLFDNGEIDFDGNQRFSNPFYKRKSTHSQANHPFGKANFNQDFDPKSIFDDLFQDSFHSTSSHPQPEKGEDVKTKITIDFLEAVNGIKKNLRFPHGKSLEITIPSGVDDGQVLRLKGQGKIGRWGGKNGDAFITIHVRPHNVFKKDHNNIYYTAPITLTEAILGGKITVPTIHGDVKISLPPYSNSGKSLRLKGKGIKSKEKAGDQYVKLEIHLPDSPSPELEEFIKKWSKKHPYQTEGAIKK